MESAGSTSSEARVLGDWTGQKSDAKSSNSRMSPSELSWLQGCLFLFLGVAGGIAGGYGLNRCQNRRTNHGTSDVELSSIRVENEIATTPFDDAESSGGDEGARSPSNLSNSVEEVIVSTRSPRCPDRNRLRSESRRRPRRLSKLTAKTRKRSRFLEFVAKTEAPNFVRRETAYSTIVTDRSHRTSSPMSSAIAGLLRPSGIEDEALSPSHPVREVFAFAGTHSCRERKRCRPISWRRMNAPEKRTKRPFENFTAKDEAWNVGRSEPANTVVVDSSSTSMASTSAVLRRPPRRHFVPRPSRKIPLVDHVQASTSDGLRRRLKVLQCSSEVKKYNGVSCISRRGLWTAEMRPHKPKIKVFLGWFESQLQAAHAVDAAFFYYGRPDITNFLHSTPAMMAMLPPIPAGLNDEDKKLFVRDKAQRLAKYAADNLAGVTDPSLAKINE